MSFTAQDASRGPGFWKLNCSLLNDVEYIDLVKKTILETKELNHDANPSLLWETVKCQIRGQSIKYASGKKRKSVNEIKNLEIGRAHV